MIYFFIYFFVVTTSTLFNMIIIKDILGNLCKREETKKRVDLWL